MFVESQNKTIVLNLALNDSSIYVFIFSIPLSPISPYDMKVHISLPLFSSAHMLRENQISSGIQDDMGKMNCQLSFLHFFYPFVPYLPLWYESAYIITTSWLLAVLICSEKIK